MRAGGLAILLTACTWLPPSELDPAPDTGETPIDTSSPTPEGTTVPQSALTVLAEDAVAVIGPGDVDGDGVDDLAVAVDGNTGEAVRLFSGRKGADPASTYAIPVGASAAGAASVLGAGHLFGQPGADRVRDLVIGTPGPGVVFLLPAPIASDTTLSEAVGTLGGLARMGSVSAGDVDGDTVDDLLVGCPLDQATAGAAYLFGSPSLGPRGIDDADAVLVGPAHGRLGGSASLAGDVDGDGRNDAVLGADGDGSVYVFDSPIAQTADGADARISGEAHVSVAAEAADFDDDGYDDVLVGGSAAAYLFSGAGLGDRTFDDADAVYVGDAPVAATVSWLADADGDGGVDLVVAAGAAYVVLAPTLGAHLLSDAPRTVSQPNGGGWVGVRAAGDPDGDGLTDLVGIAWHPAVGHGTAYLLSSHTLPW